MDLSSELFMMIISAFDIKIKTNKLNVNSTESKIIKRGNEIIYIMSL